MAGTNNRTNDRKTTGHIGTVQQSDPGIYRVSTARLQRLEAELEQELLERPSGGRRRTTETAGTTRKARGPVYAARAVSLMWALYWAYQAFASLPAALSAPTLIVHLVLPWILLFGSAIAGWRRPGVGGAILIAEGVVLSIGYTVWAHSTGVGLTATALVLAALALPPLLAGLLFAANRR